MRHEPERLTKEELEEAETVFQELEKDIPALEDAPLSPEELSVAVFTPDELNKLEKEKPL